MACIELSTVIAAPLQRCFDLSLSIDLHMASATGKRERAIAGVTSGLIGFGQQVTWKTRQFGLNISHTSLISAYRAPVYFQDRMVQGVFRRFCHDHFFELQNGNTLMKDHLEFDFSFAVVNRLVEPLFVAPRLRALLERRNAFIKMVAESGGWKQYLNA